MGKEPSAFTHCSKRFDSGVVEEPLEAAVSVCREAALVVFILVAGIWADRDERSWRARGICRLSVDYSAALRARARACGRGRAGGASRARGGNGQGDCHKPLHA